MEHCWKCRCVRFVSEAADMLSLGIFALLLTFFGAQLLVLWAARKVFPARETCREHEKS